MASNYPPYPNERPFLHEAVSRDNVDLVVFLLEKGVYINCVDEFGQTALHVAVNEGREELAHLLISKGANAYLQDNSGDSPFDLMVKQNLWQHLVLQVRDQDATKNDPLRAGVDRVRQHTNLPPEERLVFFGRDLRFLHSELSLIAPDLPNNINREFRKLDEDLKDISQQVLNIQVQDALERKRLKRMYLKNVKNLNMQHQAVVEDLTDRLLNSVHHSNEDDEDDDDEEIVRVTLPFPEGMAITRSNVENVLLQLSAYNPHATFPPGLRPPAFTQGNGSRPVLPPPSLANGRVFHPNQLRGIQPAGIPPEIVNVVRNQDYIANAELQSSVPSDREQPRSGSLVVNRQRRYPEQQTTKSVRESSLSIRTPSTVENVSSGSVVPITASIDIMDQMPIVRTEAAGRVCGNNFIGTCIQQLPGQHRNVRQHFERRGSHEHHGQTSQQLRIASRSSQTSGSRGRTSTQAPTEQPRHPRPLLQRQGSLERHLQSRDQSRDSGQIFQRRGSPEIRSNRANTQSPDPRRSLQRRGSIEGAKGSTNVQSLDQSQTLEDRGSVEGAKARANTQSREQFLQRRDSIEGRARANVQSSDPRRLQRTSSFEHHLPCMDLSRDVVQSSQRSGSINGRARADGQSPDPRRLQRRSSLEHHFRSMDLSRDAEQYVQRSGSIDGRARANCQSPDSRPQRRSSLEEHIQSRERSSDDFSSNVSSPDAVQHFQRRGSIVRVTQSRDAWHPLQRQDSHEESRSSSQARGSTEQQTQPDGTRDNNASTQSVVQTANTQSVPGRRQSRRHVPRTSGPPPPAYGGFIRTFPEYFSALFPSTSSSSSPSPESEQQ